MEKDVWLLEHRDRAADEDSWTVLLAELPEENRWFGHQTEDMIDEADMVCVLNREGD